MHGLVLSGFSASIVVHIFVSLCGDSSREGDSTRLEQDCLRNAELSKEARLAMNQHPKKASCHRIICVDSNPYFAVLCAGCLPLTDAKCRRLLQRGKRCVFFGRSLVVMISLLLPIAFPT